jgi:uncharacterized membrane protein
MPVIDTHVRVSAWLHIVQGALAVCVLGFLAVIFGFAGVAAGSAVHGPDASIVAWLASFGVALFVFILAFPLLEIVGGVMLLGGSTAGRVITLVFSVLGLINIPIGTVIGVYSLWALLREAPAAPADAVAVQPGMRST